MRDSGFEPLAFGFGGGSPERPAVVSEAQPARFRGEATPAPVQPSLLASENRKPLGPYKVQGALRAIEVGMLTVPEVAARLRLSTATIYKLVARGELTHVRVSNAIRFSRADLERFLSAGCR